MCYNLYNTHIYVLILLPLFLTVYGVLFLDMRVNSCLKLRVNEIPTYFKI